MSHQFGMTLEQAIAAPDGNGIGAYRFDAEGRLQCWASHSPNQILVAVAVDDAGDPLFQARAITSKEQQARDWSPVPMEMESESLVN